MAQATNKQFMPDEPEHPAHIPCKDTGHFTMVAQHLFRHWMPVLSDRAWKALCIVVDCTWGYQQQQAYISLSEFKRLLGIPPGQDEPVYRVLRELFFFRVVGVGNERGKRGVKAYFITETALTTHTPLVVQRGKLHVATHTGLVELLTLRERFSLPSVKGSPHMELVVKLYPIADQARREESPHDSRHGAKYTIKDIGKKRIDTPSMQLGCSAPERGREQQKVKKEPEREDAPLPSAILPQPQLATVDIASDVEELQDIWGRQPFPGEDDLKRLLDGLRREAEHVSMPGVSRKKFAEIQAVRAEYVRKKNASIRALQQMQAAYQPTIDEPTDSVPVESVAKEWCDESEQASELDEELSREDPVQSPAELLAAVVQAEQRLAVQVQKATALRAASTEAKQLYGFGSPQWSEAESRRRQAINLQQHLEDELRAKRDQCQQAGELLSAERQSVPLPFIEAEQIAVVPLRQPEMEGHPV